LFFYSFLRVVDEDLYERNMAEMRRKQEDLEKKKEQKTQEELKEATFAPHIPETSKVIAKKKLSSNTMGGESSNDVYSRLTTATSPTAGYGGGIGNESSFTHSTSNYHMNLSSSLTSQQQDQVRRGIILPEKVLSQVFERLATPSVNQMQEHIREAEQQHQQHNHESSNASTKKIVLPERQVDQIFNRLNHSKTMSFTFKHDDPQHPANHLVSPTGSASKQHLASVSEQDHNNNHNIMNRGKDKQSLQHKDSQQSNISSVTSASKDHTTPNKTPLTKDQRSASASKITPSRASKPVGKEVNATNSSLKRAINSRTPQSKSTASSSAFGSLPSPPQKKTIEGGSNAGATHSSPFPAPPAPPSTVVKSSITPSKNAAAQNDYYDDLSKKLEASLHLIQQSSTPDHNANNKNNHSQQQQHHHHKKSDAAATTTTHHQTESGNHSAPVAAAVTSKNDSNGQKYDLTETPLPKESADFINSIPVVSMEENGAEED
jgi:hypothetical protein